MLGFADTFLPWVAATWIPAFAGLTLTVSVGIALKGRYLVAYAMGIFLWFFVDTIQGSGTLDVASGFGGGISQVGKVLLFVVGVLFFFSLERDRNIFSPAAAVGKYGIAIPFLAAVALGIHGIGEGASFGGSAALTSSTTLGDAFGGLTGGIAYVLHKALEPMMIGAIYRVYAWESAKTKGRRILDSALLSLSFAIPSFLGTVNYYFVSDSSPFYALGTGTSIYVAVRLLGPLFDSTRPSNAKETIAIGVLTMLGLLSLYFAALFHSG